MANRSGDPNSVGRKSKENPDPPPEFRGCVPLLRCVIRYWRIAGKIAPDHFRSGGMLIQRPMSQIGSGNRRGVKRRGFRPSGSEDPARCPGIAVRCPRAPTAAHRCVLVGPLESVLESVGTWDRNQSALAGSVQTLKGPTVANPARCAAARSSPRS
jgi:hypothetical protein